MSLPFYDVAMAYFNRFAPRGVVPDL